LCSGYSQYHTDKNKPLIPITWQEIQALVDNPSAVEKKQARWFIPSNALTRSKDKAKLCDPKYWALWFDFDLRPKPFQEMIALVVGLLNSANFEYYLTRSATINNHKGRLLIPLHKPLCFDDWEVCQKVLNDFFAINHAIPDRANEGMVQLCYLPNRGSCYMSYSVRDGQNFDAIGSLNSAIQKECERISRERQKKTAATVKSISKRRPSLISGRESPITDFNRRYSVEQVLVKSGYDQKGTNFRHPNSESGSYSCSVKDGRAFTLSSSDPLHTGKDSFSHDAFDVFCILHCNGSSEEAIKVFRSGDLTQ